MSSPGPLTERVEDVARAPRVAIAPMGPVSFLGRCYGPLFLATHSLRDTTHRIKLSFASPLLAAWIDVGSFASFPMSK